MKHRKAVAWLENRVARLEHLSARARDIWYDEEEEAEASARTNEAISDLRELIKERDALRQQVATLRADLQRIQGEAWQRGHDIDRLRADLELATLEVEALRRQVAELLANGVSMHKAADRAAKAERAAIVAWLREYGWVGLRGSDFADGIERGDHEVQP